MENVLIIGGNRFVGKALSERLLHKGVQVDVFNRSGTSSDLRTRDIEGIDIIQGDRNKPEDLAKIDFTKYDCIVDMCLFFESQFDLIEHLIPNETNYIFVSSGAADDRYIEHYGDYGVDKKKVESRLEDSDINFKIVRPSYIVGKGNHRPRLGHYMNKIIHKEHIEIAGDGKNTINIVFVQDVVDCLEEIIFNFPAVSLQQEVVGTNIEVIDLIYKVFKYVLDDTYEGDVMLVQNDETALFPKNDFEFNEYTSAQWKLNKPSFDERLKNYAEWYYKKGEEQYGHII